MISTDIIKADTTQQEIKELVQCLHLVSFYI